jgi:hypothetical protein
LGIELTAFFYDADSTGSPFERTQSLRREVLERASAVYHHFRPDAPLQVWCQWSDYFEIQRGNVKPTAAKLVQLVLALVPEPEPGRTYFLADEELCESPMKDELWSVRVVPLRSGAPNRWASTYTNTAHTTPAHIEAVIATKESKLDQYLRKCSRVWLLIHDKRGALDISDELVEPEYETRFERVYLYDVFVLRPTALKVSSPQHSKA